MSRHSGAQEWARRQGIAARFIEHLDPELIQSGDLVMGTLPLQAAARVIEKGGVFQALVVDVPAARRGAELTADELTRYSAHLADASVKLDTRTVNREPVKRPPAFKRVRTLTASFLRFLPAFGAVVAFVLLQSALFEILWSWERPAPLGGGRLSIAEGTSMALGCFLVLAITGFAVYSYRHALLRHVLSQHGKIQECPVAVIALSPLRASPGALDAARKLGLDLFVASEEEFTGAVEKQRLENPSEAEEMMRLRADSFCNWQQNLRALAVHKNTLHTVFVFGTAGQPGSQGSVAELPQFFSFASELLSGAGRKVNFPDTSQYACDVNDFPGVRLAVDAMVRAAGALGANPQQISIDVTSGTAVFSVAAAMATVNTDIQLTYIDNKGAPRAYAARLELGEFSV